MAFNFSTTESAKATPFIKPGRYKFNIKEVKLAKSKSSNTEFLTFTFENTDGQALTENFMLTEKALGRLQYLHEAWTGKKLNKNFATTKEVADYFAKIFVSPKAGSRILQVNGKQVDGNVYGELPYTEFILPEDTELGEFEEGSKEWKDFVKKATATKNESSGKKGGVLNDDDDDTSDSKADAADDDDEPW